MRHAVGPMHVQVTTELTLVQVLPIVGGAWLSAKAVADNNASPKHTASSALHHRSPSLIANAAIDRTSPGDRRLDHWIKRHTRAGAGTGISGAIHRPVLAHAKHVLAGLLRLAETHIMLGAADIALWRA
ncbi:hypothetical protein G3572_02210 [Rhodobacter sp. ETT8]|uniref:Uncharacterized protein n=2 Tax=Pseudotabrizicola algicola TaxID=2709381 RepID=A0A6B3RPM6_9RHOB|nr:hypothetical protein [Pseudotabrizicola algicola]